MVTGDCPRKSLLKGSTFLLCGQLKPFILIRRTSAFVLQRRYAKFFLEHSAKMRNVFKAAVESYFTDSLVSSFNQHPGVLKPSVY